MARRNSCWSFNAGARGRNWVRPYEKVPGGIIFLEWREPVLDEEGHPVRDPDTGSPLERRRRTSTGHRDRTKAKRQAQELADRFGEMVTTAAVLTLRRLIHLYVKAAPRVPGSPWLIPAEEDPSRPVSIHVLNLWLQRAKDRAGLKVKGLGFHAQKRAGVRRKEFRELPPKVQEALTGTNHETLRKVYDDVSLDEMREAVERLSAPRRRRADWDQMSLGLTGED